MKKLLIILSSFLLVLIVIIGCVLAANPIARPSTLLSKLLADHPEEINQQDDWSVSIWSRVNDKRPTPANKTVEFDDEVKLIAVITHKGTRYSDDQSLIDNGLTRKMDRLPGSVEFRWYKLEAEYYLYCTKAGYKQEFGQHGENPHYDFLYDFFSLDVMEYKQTSFAGNNSIVDIDQQSDTNIPLKWDGKYVGTMRYKVEISAGDLTVSSHGKKHLDSGRFSQQEKVHRISVKAKTGSPILDMGFAHGNLPYYYGSNSFRWGWYGSDCAKFVSVVYRKTVTPDFGYLSTYSLVNRPCRAVIDGKDREGFFLYRGSRIKYGALIRPGDIIVISPAPYHHAGLIGQDINHNGYLDEDDYVLHTSFRAPEYQPLGDTLFSSPNKNLKIVR